MIIGGRGSGKTRAGAEWISAMARGLPGFTIGETGHIALIGETLADVRDVMVEGPSGILAIAKGLRPRFEVSRRRVLWDNGAVAMLFSSEDPESLRGPQFDAAWCDELCKWKNDQATFDMLQFGLRLGHNPKQVITTTPKPTVLFKQLLTDRSFVKTHMQTADNAEHLAKGFVESITKRYSGSRLGRQELDGELIEERDGAFWSRAMLDGLRVKTAPELSRIVIAVDPPVTSHAKSDACGIIAVGLGKDGHGYVLADGTLKGATPAKWGQSAIALYHQLEADCLIVEVNQGGDLVKDVISGIDENVALKAVRAKRAKHIRAEPVAALYEQGRVHHVGASPLLEDEMCDFGTNGLSTSKSPDRVDAMVWAATELLLSSNAEPRIRRLD